MRQPSQRLLWNLWHDRQTGEFVLTTNTLIGLEVNDVVSLSDRYAMFGMIMGIKQTRYGYEHYGMYATSLGDCYA